MNDKRTSLYSVDSNKIEQLLSECFETAENDQQQPVEDIQDLLQSYWESRVLLESPEQEHLSFILTQIQNEAYSLHSSNRVKDVLLDPQTDLELIKAVKDEYKNRSRESEIQKDKDIFMILYYSAVASGLVHHHAKISSYSLNQIQKAISKLQQVEWILPDIKQLLQKAVDWIKQNPDL